MCLPSPHSLLGGARLVLLPLGRGRPPSTLTLISPGPSSCCPAASGFRCFPSCFPSGFSGRLGDSLPVYSRRHEGCAFSESRPGAPRPERHGSPLAPLRPSLRGGTSPQPHLPSQAGPVLSTALCPRRQAASLWTTSVPSASSVLSTLSCLFCPRTSRPSRSAQTSPQPWASRRQVQRAAPAQRLPRGLSFHAVGLAPLPLLTGQTRLVSLSSQQ